MDAIIVLIGLGIGVAIFLALMNSITAIVYNCTSVAITFGICWAIGIVLAWIAWKIALIIGIIALIIFIIGKVTGAGKKTDGENKDGADADDSKPQDDE